jgi:hypothetical protein
MKVWEVTEHDTQLRFYWYETIKEARHHRAEFMKERENPDHTCEISEVEFTGSPKQVVVRAMNYVIKATCFNEG